MESVNVLELLRDAMDLERAGQHFYNKAAKHSKTQYVKKIFKRLAGDEMIHFEKLELVFDTFCENNEWMVEADFALPERKELNIEDIFNDKELVGDYDEMQAIEIGIDHEQKSITLYKKAYAACKGNSEKGCVVFKWLIDFEKGHMSELKDLEKKLKENKKS